MKLAIITVTVFALTLSATALGARHSATLTIRHQTKGCHSWSFDGKSWRASQSITMTRGGAIAIVDNDVMPQTVVQLSGPRSTVAAAAMKRIGATARIAFPAKGRYVFATTAGEDYVKGVKTTGEDNVLRLVVTVV